MTEDVCSDSDSDFALQNDDDVELEVPSNDAAVRRSPRVNKKPDYHSVKIDKTFCGRPGYTHFGRTRKGGDKRPRRAPQKAASEQNDKTRAQNLTMLNFFASAGKQPLPLPAQNVMSKKKNKYRRATQNLTPVPGADLVILPN